MVAAYLPLPDQSHTSKLPNSQTRSIGSGNIFLDKKNKMRSWNFFWILCLLSWVLPEINGVKALGEEAQILLRMKKSLKDPHNAMKNWEESIDAPCNWNGIKCENATGKVTEITIESKLLNGPIYSEICFLQSLKKLHLGDNDLHGNFPSALLNCSKLESLNLTTNHLTGTLPDLSPLKSLQILDLTTNKFTGEFPASVGNLPELTSLNLAENPFKPGKIPERLMNLKNLTLLYLSSCNLIGEIPRFIFDFTELGLLDLSLNSLNGSIPKEISKLKKLYQLELYDNHLTGNIPRELGNLTSLRDFDASVNMFSGSIPEELGNLRNLISFQLYTNKLSGQIPESFGELPFLEGLSLYENNFTGQLPQKLGSLSKFNMIDVSENRFSGPLPKDICRGGNLQYFLILENGFTGELPQSYGDCKSLVRFRINNNNLQGKVPKGIWGLPNATIIDLSFNNFRGGLSSEIANAKNLSQLFIQNNQFSGNLVPEIGMAAQLAKIVANDNQFTGSIPKEIGGLSRLNMLHLQENLLEGSIPDQLGLCTYLSDINLAGNHLDGSIPKSLASIDSLNSLNVSKNELSGPIPSSLSSLKLSSIDFSNNQLTGPVPNSLVSEANSRSFYGNPGLCAEISSNDDHHTLVVCPTSHPRKESRETKVIACFIVGAAMAIFIIGLLLFRRRYNQNQADLTEKMESSSWRLKSFHKLSFNEEEISEALLDEENVIGSGGSGKVYRVDLKNNETVAVKRLWMMNMNCNKQHHNSGLNGSMKAEVDTLGMVRHKNIVKLYCCLTNSHSNLLVYEYMPNGNLFDALHKSNGEKDFNGSNLNLDWLMRYKIALGAAHGLAYLHHDCTPAIVHRDIKSTNILLDEFYEAKIADFGVAKILQVCGGGKDSCTAFAGTHGYIAPEYAYSLKVTEKSDIYSFGVVLLELVSGKRPIEPEFGENKDIVNWISHKICTREDAFEILDSKISKSSKEEMIEVLKIAVRCTCKLPTLRPSMREVVQMLLDVDPCSSILKTAHKGKDLKDTTIVLDTPAKANYKGKHQRKSSLERAS
eukprot:Gb_15787 [translate_table: standard]